MGPKSNDRHFCKRQKKETKKYSGKKSSINYEVEVRGMCLQIKEHQGWPAVPGTRGGKDLPVEPLEPWKPLRF